MISQTPDLLMNVDSKPSTIEPVSRKPLEPISSALTLVCRSKRYDYLLYNEHSFHVGLSAAEQDSRTRSMILQADTKKYAGVIGLTESKRFDECLRKLGFEEAGQLILRRRYLKLFPFGDGLGVGRLSFRAMARFSNNIRHRIVEADIDNDSLATMARIYERSQKHFGSNFSVDRTINSLKKKYMGEAQKDHYVLFLRKDVGAKTDSYIVFREHTDELNRQTMVIEDFWTSRGGRREVAWLITEACIWALGTGFCWVDDWTMKGSREHGVSRLLGAVRQQDIRRILVRNFSGSPALDLRNGYFRFSDFSILGD
ncbi:MAG: hypothetical protein VYC39_02385 [Myxococcota bacterium]|nr:hypothetical protein [Myxococcota bacterium]